MTENDRSRKTANRVAVVLLLVVVSAVFVRMIWNLLLAITVAAVVAGLAFPLYDRLLRAVRGRKAAASALTVIIVIFSVVIPLLVLIDVVAAQAIDVGQSLAPTVNQLIHQMAEAESPLESLPFWDRIEPYSDEIVTRLGEVAQAVGSFVVGGLSAAAQGAIRFFFSLFIMLYALFYLLMNGRETLDSAMGLIPIRPTDKKTLVATFVTVSRATIKGTLVIGIIQGGLAGAAFAVAGIPSAVFWGTVMAVLSVVPGIGTALVWLPAVLFLFASGHVGPAVALLLWCALVVGSADNVLRPLLVGRDTEMPNLLVMVSTFGGLTMFGAVGLVLGPVVAALFLAVVRIYADTFSGDSMPAPEATGGVSLNSPGQL